MKEVSNAYKRDMKQILRNSSFVKIVFQNIDTSAAGDGYWDDNGHTAYSETDTLDYERIYGRTMATLELNRWTLDALYDIYDTDKTYHDGYTSSVLSDENGEFDTAPILFREFSVYHSMAGLTMVFDSRGKEYPMEGTIKFYKDGNVIEIIAIHDPESIEIIVDQPVESYDKIEVSPSVMLPYHRFRVEEIYFGVINRFENKDIITLHTKHDVDPLSRRLPIEQLNFTVLDFEHKYDPDNPKGWYVYVEEKAPVSIAFGYALNDGTIEWLEPNLYLLDAKPMTNNARVSFTASGLVGSMTGTYYKDTVGTKNLYDMAEAILIDANLTKTRQGDDPWIIDESLKDMYTTAVLPIDTHANNLQRIAHAARCRLYTDSNNIIRIAPFGVSIVGIYEGVTTDNGHENFSEWDTVDTGNPNNRTYATLELNRWVLAETSQQDILPDSDPTKYGYISSIVSDENGDYGMNPVFERVFDNTCDLNALRIRFDSATDEWVRKIKVEYFRGDTLIDTKVVDNIDEVEGIVTSTNANLVNKLRVTILKSAPYRRCRVERMYFRTSDFMLDFTSIVERSQVISKIDRLKSIAVSQYAYVEGTENIVLYSGTCTKENLHVEFGQPVKDVTITVEDGTLISSEIYGRAADLKLTSGTKTVEIRGYPLTETNETTKTLMNATGEEDVEENTLITSDEMREALTQHIIDYLSMRSTYDVQYRGNPELEAGDIIGMQTRYTNDMDVLILVDEITFNGAISGTLKAKGLA